MTDATKKTVATPSADYKAHEITRTLVRTLMGGTHAMRLAGQAYLPQENGESGDAYAARLNRTTLFNAFRKTVKDMAGRVFAKPIAIGDDVPPLLVEHAENIDLTGRNLNTFAFEICKDALQTGVSFILADMPPAQAEGTRADEIASGRRAYLVHVKADDLIGWKSELIEGQETLTQIRIRETVYEPSADSPFEDVAVTQIRVLERPNVWQIWREVKDADGNSRWVVHDEGTTTLSYIALAAVYFQRTGFMTGEPPLMDLADLNVAHWQSHSDQRNIVHVARVPILFGAGFDETATFTVGAGTMARSSSAEAKLTYVEHSGAAIGSGRDDLKDLELQMQAMGLQLLVSSPGQTATGELRDDTKENSPLAMMAHALQDGLEQALGFMADFEGLGKDAGGSLVVNTDFGVASRDVTDQQTLLAATSNGLITHETFLREMQRRGVLADDLDVDAEIANLSLMAEEADAEPLQPGGPDQGQSTRRPPSQAAAAA